MRQPANTVYTFGEFRLAPSEGLLLRNGAPIPLTPKAFDALVLLLENAGHLVTKEEFMQRLWPETFVGDDTLAQNISLLRKALANGSGSEEWVVTVPRRGYRFAGSVRRVLEPPSTEETSLQKNTSAASAEAGHQPLVQENFTRPWLSRTRLLLAAIGIGVLAGVFSYVLLVPPALPRVIRVTRLTHSGRVDWQKLITDGSRLYFLEREGDHWNVAQTSLAGGETQIVPAPFQNTLLLDLSPDHSEFLLASFTFVGGELPLWIWPVQGGPAIRVGGLTVYDAAWHPNGRQIVFGKNSGVYIADLDGSHVTKLAATQGPASRFVWSSDGRVLRFSVSPVGIQNSSLWEIQSDGSNLHQLLPAWSRPPGECCGSWSRDGKYFFFGSSHAGSADIWGIQEKRAFLHTRQSDPFRLTTGPSDMGDPLVSPTDSHRLYVSGVAFQIELTSYDPKTRQSTAMLPGSRADHPRYSADGEWLVYTAPPHDVWRMRRDGSARTHLAATPTLADNPVFSPDAKQIAFVSHPAECENKLYALSAEGGIPRELFPNDCEQFDPAWSPDGKLLGFARAKFVTNQGFEPSTIELLELATNRVTTLKDSKGMRAPSWSPDGKFIAALTEDYRKLMLFDVRSERWVELAQGTSLKGALRWSRDSASLYFQDWRAPGEPVYRVRLRDRKREEVANFENFIRSGIERCAFEDLAPDGSLVVALLRNHADIYALDLELP